MSNTNKLYRNFIILQEEQRGESGSNDKSLSGYSKIEAKGDKCKVSFYAQNIRKDSGDYSVMLICNNKGTKNLIDLGEISTSDSGKAEITKEYLSNNVAGVNISFDRISGAAIAKTNSGAPIFIMYGFINGEIPSDDWKSYKVIKADESNVNLRNKVEVSKKEVESKKNKMSEHTKVEEIKEELKDVGERNNFDEYEASIEEASEEFKVRGSVGEYFEGIANGFEYCKNAYKEIKHCKWYKIPVNDLYEMCNMSNYNKYTVAYYPMLNYYPYIKKYGHFMLGYKCDAEGNLKYIVYGIPGKRDKEEQPYEGKTGFVTWVSDEDNDDLGCWLMFYDFKNSTVVVPMQ